MAINESVLAEKHNIITLSIKSSDQISNRTAAVIEKLHAVPDDGKSNVLVLKGKARTANKLVSIVEIAKREMAKAGHKCFQYNALSSEMIEIERIPKQGANGTKEGAAESESDDAFESMGVEPKTGTRKRLIPVMTTYLCATSVKELKNAYGEQT